MKRLLFPFLLGAVALLAPGRSLAQEKPVLNTAPIVIPAPTQPTPAPVPAPVDTTRRRPAKPTYTPPAGYDEPQQAQPNSTSPSGLELPGREQARKAAQEHADQYTKFFIYSGFGFSYNQNQYYDGGALNLSASPALGYRINDRVSIGPGISYAYTSQTFGKGQPTLSLSNFGGKVFAQVRVIDQFLVHAEYEVTSAQLPVVDAQNRYLLTSSNQFLTTKRTISSPLAGVGYRSQFSNRVAGDLLVLYNFNDSFNNSIYSNPVIRFNILVNIGR
ncbi:MAG: hypothetical protein ACRYFX_30130 [Janthinobacterium lividum]